MIKTVIVMGTITERNGDISCEREDTLIARSNRRPSNMKRFIKPHIKHFIAQENLLRANYDNYMTIVI